MGNIEFSKIQGSTGSSFLVIAEREGLALGVRPIAEAVVPGAITFLGVRIRVAPTNADEVEDPSVYGTFFPKIEFSKMDNVRASTVVGMAINRPTWMVQDLREIMSESGMVAKIVSWLQEHAGPVDVERLTALQERLTAEFESIFAKSALEGTPVAATDVQEGFMSADEAKENFAKLMKSEKDTSH